jgi:hypothetical protein
MCTILLLVSASSQPRGMEPMQSEKRAEQLKELLDLTDAQTESVKQILQTSKKTIEANFEAEDDVRFSMRSAMKKIRKATDRQILAILDSKKKEQFVGKQKERLPEPGVQFPDLRDLQQIEMEDILEYLTGSGSTDGAVCPEDGPPFWEVARSELPFPLMKPMFAADRAAQLQDRLDLTDAQTSKVESLFLSEEKEIRKIQESMHDSLEILHTKLFKEQREVYKKIAGLLTEEQREMYGLIRRPPPEMPAEEDQPPFDY